MTFTEHPIYVLCMLCLMVLLAYYATKTTIGKKFGVTLLVIVFTAVIANLKLIPSASNAIPLYGVIFKYLAPIAIFFLLLKVNIATIRRAGAPMIILFLIGALGTTFGVLVSWYLINPQEIIGEQANIIAGMLTGTYTGGSVNFNAIALEYDFQKQGILYVGTIAADNLVSTVWILVTLALPPILNRFWKQKKINNPSNETFKEEKDQLDFHSLTWLVFLGLASYVVSMQLSKLIPAVPFILILTTLAILLAQTPFVAKLKGSHSLGLYLVYIFLAVVGAYSEISAVIALKETGLLIFAFTACIVLIHGVITFVVGSLFYRDWEMISIVSQANIGGGTTAIANVEAFRRNELILPAILVGALGNAIGTYLGFLVIQIVS